MSEPKLIIGENQMFSYDDDPNAIPSKIHRRLDAIGKLDGQCTAFHIGNGEVLSAAHCFKFDIKAGDHCIHSDIRWVNGTRSQCIQILGKELSPQRDFILFEVDPAPEAYFSIEYEKRDESILILGFPHEQSLSVSKNCKISFSKLDQLYHDCDSLPGQSGSPILSEATGNVIGIHNGGEGELNYGTFFTNWTKVLDQANRIRTARLQSNQRLSFGPFHNNESRFLRYFPSIEGPIVQFKLDYDVEEQYDFINVRDGQGKWIQLSGQNQSSFELKTPVIVTFESDYGGQSKKISFEKIKFL